MINGGISIIGEELDNKLDNDDPEDSEGPEDPEDPEDPGTSDKYEDNIEEIFNAGFAEEAFNPELGEEGFNRELGDEAFIIEFVKEAFDREFVKEVLEFVEALDIGDEAPTTGAVIYDDNTSEADILPFIYSQYFNSMLLSD